MRVRVRVRVRERVRSAPRAKRATEPWRDPSMCLVYNPTILWIITLVTYGTLYSIYIGLNIYVYVLTAGPGCLC